MAATSTGGASPRLGLRRAVILAIVLVLLATGALVWWRVTAGPALDPQAAARTAFPDLAPATGPPTLPSLETAAPRRGTVVQAAGPFDDRFVLRDLAFDGASVTGTAEITSDVSELLEFEALAGFYDADGKLIGTARYVHHLDHGAGHEEGDAPEGGPAEIAETFRIDVPKQLRRAAVAAAVGVPVLVNE